MRSAILGVLLVGCSSSASLAGLDASPADATTGIADAAPGQPDARTVSDAGGLSDAAGIVADAAVGLDAGVADVATSPDAAWDPSLVAPALACADTTDSVYLTPPGLPPMTDQSRGDVVKCALDFYLDVPGVQHVLDGDPYIKGATAVTGVKAVSGVSIYRIAYRTTRRTDPGVSTARVYLPDTPKAGPLPLIAIGHPSDGLSDQCAPSKDANANRELALPWAALGYAVIATDYAGLGNEGTQGYLDNRDQAHSLLDSARALRKLLKTGAFEPRVVVAGWSQGGGAALSSQALEKEYGAGGPIAATLVFAPEYPTRLNSFAMVHMLQSPDDLTISWMITNPVVLDLRLYAWYANTQGQSHATDGFPANNRSRMGTAIETSCLIELGGFVQGYAPHVSGLIDDTLRTTFLSCVDDASGAGCIAPGKALYQELIANQVTNDPTGAPVLYVQGLKDTVMPPAAEAACNLQKLQADGLTPQACTDAAAQHTDVVERNIAFGIQWAEAVLAGKSPPTCSAAGMPTCQP
jgi:dienelactone hydrolase